MASAERAAISPEMALRIEKWLGPENGGDASVWIAQQAAYDLWLARKQSAAKIRQVKRAKIALQPLAEHPAARERR